MTKVHVFPYSPRPGTATAAADSVPAATKDRARACASAFAGLLPWRAGGEDRARGRRPRRPPWTRLRRRLFAVVRRRPRSASSFALGRVPSPRRGSPRRLRALPLLHLVREGESTSTPATGFVAVRRHPPEGRDAPAWCSPSGRLEFPRDLGFPAEEAKRMLEFVAETAKVAGARRLPARGERRPGCRARRSSTCTGTSSAGGSGEPADDADRQARERAQGGDGSRETVSDATRCA